MITLKHIPTPDPGPDPIREEEIIPGAIFVRRLPKSVGGHLWGVMIVGQPNHPIIASLSNRPITRVGEPTAPVTNGNRSAIAEHLNEYGYHRVTRGELTIEAPTLKVP